MTMNKDIWIQEKIKQYPWLQEKINEVISNVANKWKEDYNNWLAETLYDTITEEINWCIDVADQKEIATKLVNDLIDRYQIDASDWYHTFSELYKHRHHLVIALCSKSIDDMNNPIAQWCSSVYQVSKSKVHYDWLDVWKEWEMFIIQLETSEWQISYHLPNEYWSKCSFIDTLDKANKWDWHTSDDVLKKLLLI